MRMCISSRYAWTSFFGAAAGAGAGTAATVAAPRSQATLPAGSTVTVRLTGPATITIEE